MGTANAASKKNEIGMCIGSWGASGVQPECISSLEIVTIRLQLTSMARKQIMRRWKLKTEKKKTSTESVILGACLCWEEEEKL